MANNNGPDQNPTRRAIRAAELPGSKGVWTWPSLITSAKLTQSAAPKAESAKSLFKDYGPSDTIVVMESRNPDI